MKVGIVTPVYPPYHGGMGLVAAREAGELAARGVEVEVFTPDYPARAKQAGVNYLPIWFSFGNAACVPALVKRLMGCDLAHLHYPFYGADQFVWLWSVLKRRPYVLTYHMQAKTNDWRNLIFIGHRWLFEPFVVRQASAVLVSSFDYAKSIGLKHQNLIEFPFGVDELRFSPGKDENFRAEHGIPGSSLVFIFVGGLDRAHSFKGVDVLIRAAASLPRTQDWRLLIVGDGDMRSAYVELAGALGLSEQIIFAGSVSPADLPRAYRAADVHILPSVSKSEAFGLVTLEAAASGLASIVSDLPGVRTLVVPAETGLVVEPGVEEPLEAAMQSYLDDASSASLMGAKARKRILDAYTARALADRLLQVYNGVIS